ncbi:MULTISPECIES: 5-(carboxyamino)imidazole ribonucleotide synthase [unclassified Actinomyces]|uniref:5-(carboxyamino)imidazole ribonucleotide synthase n=1 Tax=unclassified Actinomyces TaxID=2609248 RepID=UPI000D5900A3|nr:MULTISPECIES: ATP-grasp domain-containing protein [unclassified Actinomyces]RAX21859.1 ATP-grasp domain-containing protein [Actinomyces sp. Z5]RAX22912.1 ATP-grasp domain-containing protein [Actinomyces sp. Z3]
MSAPILAVIGGGQLARMMQEEASALGIHLRTLVETPDGSAAQVTVDAPVGRADDADAVRALVTGAAALTFEHEHQDSALLTQLQAEGVPVRPAPEALLLARDKLAMRRAVDAAGLPQPAWAEIAGNAQEMRAQIGAFAADHGWPVVLKTPRGGYDGHGVLMVDSATALDDGEAATWLEATAAARAGHATNGTGGGGSLGGGAVTSLLVEAAVPFTRELAVLLARRPSGQIAVWPVIESVQSDGICVETVAPAPGLDPAAARQAEHIGRTIAERADVTGVLAVELFAVEAPEGTRLYINELAMRPHNSGHWTQDGALTSQFAQHLRAVLDLPLGATTPTAPTTVMVNYLGGDSLPPADVLARALECEPRAHIHLYGKQWRPGRKLGHVNLTTSATDPAEIDAVRERARAVVAILRGEA